MKVVILGAKGNLGTQLRKAFADTDVEAWDREEVDFLMADILAEKLRLAKPDIIINAAAYNAVDKCEQDEGEKVLAFQLNENLPAILAELALELQATLVHYSTDYVFAGDNPEGYLETDEPKPINVYGASKLAGEKAIIELLSQGLKAYIIRTSKLFGPRGASAFAKPAFFDLMLDLSQSRPELQVVDEELSAFTYTPDLAQATKTLVASYQPGIYHIVNSGAVTWYEAAKTLFDIVGRSVKVVPVSGEAFARPALRPKFSPLLNTKGPSLRSWQEALRHYLSLNQ